MKKVKQLSKNLQSIAMDPLSGCTRQKLENEEREASKQALGTLMLFAKGFVFSFCQYL